MDDWETVTCMAFRYTGPGGRVVVPEEIAVIGRGAFLGSKGVTEIVIHRDVTVVQEGAFAGCTELERFVVDPDNKYYEAHGAFLLVKNTGTLLSAPAVRGDVELPPEITELKGAPGTLSPSACRKR